MSRLLRQQTSGSGCDVTERRDWLESGADTTAFTSRNAGEVITGVAGEHTARYCQNNKL